MFIVTSTISEVVEVVVIKVTVVVLTTHTEVAVTTPEDRIATTPVAATQVSVQVMEEAAIPPASLWIK